MPDPRPASEPPGLPAEAPPWLRDFVECRAVTLRLEAGRAPWIPSPPVVGRFAGKPSARFHATTAPGRIRITLSWFLASLDITVWVRDGLLEVDTSRVPAMLRMREPIENWVRELNAHVAHNGYRLGELHLDGDVVTGTKVRAPG